MGAGGLAAGTSRDFSEVVSGTTRPLDGSRPRHRARLGEVVTLGAESRSALGSDERESARAPNSGSRPTRRPAWRPSPCRTSSCGAWVSSMDVTRRFTAALRATIGIAASGSRILNRRRGGSKSARRRRSQTVRSVRPFRMASGRCALPLADGERDRLHRTCRRRSGAGEGLLREGAGVGVQRLRP